MRTRIATAACLLAALVGCGSSTPQTTPAKTTAAAVTAATAAATTASHTVKLSTKWVPKLDALSNGTGVSDCQQSGSTACVQAQTKDLNAFSGIIEDINAAGVTAEYPKTIAEINQLVRAAETFDKDGCPGDPNADIDGSPCYSNAQAVAVGVSTLSFILPTDELNAGVS